MNDDTNEQEPGHDIPDDGLDMGRLADIARAHGLDDIQASKLVHAIHVASTDVPGLIVDLMPKIAAHLADDIKNGGEVLAKIPVSVRFNIQPAAGAYEVSTAVGFTSSAKVQSETRFLDDHPDLFG